MGSKNDFCEWQYNYEHERWVCGCGHRQDFINLYKVCPECKSPSAASRFDVDMWKKDREARNDN